MNDELRRLERLARELEPLAYFYERNKAPLFRVCYDLRNEYKRLAASIKKDVA